MSIINEWLDRYGKLHFSLIDPDKQPPSEAGEKAKKCSDYGTNAIMVGGTTVSSREMVYKTVSEIKKKTDVPVILFPNSKEFLVENADYIFFMSLLNSKDYKHKFGEQLEGALVVKKLGIKPIPTGYLVISTSPTPTTVEMKTNLDRIDSDDMEKAVKYALYTEYTGMHCLYMDAGSNPYKPISDEMVREVRKNISIPLIIGGGIRDGETARRKVEAGADIIVTGTAVEENIGVVEEIIGEIKREG
ncbi:MAG: geranylgeranylglyceryl/heptaprenylglyceryl phosphate synthase [Thermoplasmata archaeon]|nr:MAG: geranylgeranylglyceryl/heptaprenylglyceryl phosphate synthase [Thermoplasmata archaeon]RLF64542.1 MAG: geranylgeranylglyceryl/heptaprenylglyceryl phosphate synthase [Thermoplasmata archaeon]